MTGGTIRLSTGLRVAGRTGILDAPAVVRTLAFGTASGRVMQAASFTRTVDAGQTWVITLDDGSIPDIEAGTITLANLREFSVWIISGGDSSGVRVRPAASNGNPMWFTGTTPGHVIYPDGPAYLGGSPDGVAVDSTHHAVEVANLGAVAATLRVTLAGVGAFGYGFFPSGNLITVIG